MPYQQSADMAAKLAAAGVEHKLITVPAPVMASAESIPLSSGGSTSRRSNSSRHIAVEHRRRSVGKLTSGKQPL